MTNCALARRGVVSLMTNESVEVTVIHGAFTRYGPSPRPKLSALNEGCGIWVFDAQLTKVIQVQRWKRR